MSKEMVDHPAHYNLHPSGVEAIEVIRSMCFNIGNSFKYVYRRNQKNNTRQDIKKAIWYVEDEINRRKKANYTFIEKFMYVAQMIVRRDVFIDHYNRSNLIIKISKAEPNKMVANIYKLLHDADINYWDVKSLEGAKIRLEKLLK